MVKQATEERLTMWASGEKTVGTCGFDSTVVINLPAAWLTRRELKPAASPC